MTTNKIILKGVLMHDFKIDHCVSGENFLSNMIKVDRLSGIHDELPVLISERLLKNNKISKDSEVALFGQLRSVNIVENGKSKLLKRLFVSDILDDCDEVNHVELFGYLCAPPVYRTTPKGREICEVILAVSRKYGKNDYIHCIAWGRNARFAETFAVGDKIHVIGRFQSREYDKVLPTGTVKLVAYEVSTQLIELYTEVQNDSSN